MRFIKIPVVIFFLVLNGSGVHAQTFEQTEEWIKAKMDKYGGQGYSILSASDCMPIMKGQAGLAFVKKPDYDSAAYITIRLAREIRKQDEESYQVKNYNFYTLFIRNMTNVSTVTNCSQSFIRLSGRVISNDQEESVQSINIYLPWDNEPDLMNRMVKAFKYLLQFNKPSEVF